VPYVLKPPFVDGAPPSSSYWEENSNYQPEPGEVVISKEEYESAIEPNVSPGVWDEATQTLRKRTHAEKISDVKAERKKEFANQAGVLIGKHLIFPTMGEGDREVLLILTATLKQICDVLGVVPDERIALIADTGALVLDAVNRVEAIPNDAPDAEEQVLSIELPSEPA
jgi:hypothetical protein